MLKPVSFYRAIYDTILELLTFYRYSNYLYISCNSPVQNLDSFPARGGMLPPTKKAAPVLWFIHTPNPIKCDLAGISWCFSRTKNVMKREDMNTLSKRHNTQLNLTLYLPVCRIQHFPIYKTLFPNLQITSFQSYQCTNKA